MARYQTASFTTSSVAASEWLSINHAIYDSMINLVKIKVVPNTAGGTSRFQVYKRDTFLEADKLYDTRDFTGALIDPVEDYSDPMTDTPGATAERNEGSPIPYEDDDATNEIHMRVYNGDVTAKTYTVTVKYEHVLVPTGLVGDVLVKGNLTVTGATTSGNATIQGTLDTTHLQITGTIAHMPNPLFAGSEGYGATGLVWDHTIAGWGWGLRVKGDAANSLGLLVTCNPSSMTSVLKAESTSYPNTFVVSGDGRVGITNATPPAVFYVGGNQRPADYTFIAEKSVANDAPTALFIGTQAGGHLIECRYYITTAIKIHTGSALTLVDLVARDFGAGANGAFINIGRNTNGPHAGYINFYNQSGGPGCVWADANTILRIAGGGPASVGDQGGTIVGAQGSARRLKQEIKPLALDERTAIVRRICNAPLSTYELISEIGNNPGLKHLGFMADEQPMWTRYDGNSIDEHRISMEILVALQALAKFVGFRPDPPEGPPAGVGRFINGQEGIKPWAKQDES